MATSFWQWATQIGAAFAAPAGLVIGHKLKPKRWYRRWFLLLIAGPAMVAAVSERFRANLLVVSVGLLSYGFYLGQWEGARDDWRLLAKLERRRLFEVYGAIVFGGAFVSGVAQMFYWAFWLDDATAIPLILTLSVHIFTALVVVGVWHYVLVRRRIAKRVGLRTFSITPDLPR